MIFNNDRPIFQQMADRLCDEIVVGTYGDDSRIPSVREYAVLLEVNVNTAVKAYEQLARADIIYNKRGLGYYVKPGARKLILKGRRRLFLNETIPELYRQMQFLGLTPDDVAEGLRTYQQAP